MNLLLVLASFAGIACGNKNPSEEPPKNDGPDFATTPTVEMPLGGNSYVTSTGAGGGAVTDAGFGSWTSPATVFSTFFRVNRGGDLILFLRYGAEGDGGAIEVSCGGETFEVALPKTATSTPGTVYVGTIADVEPGYVKVDFKGKTIGSGTYGSPSSLFVGGAASKEMNFVGDFSFYWGRRGPSVHMGYTIPEGVTAEWFYNEVTVPVGFDPVGSYFMVNGFGEGYCGIQVNSATERRVLFSVWSPYETDDPSSIPDEDRVKLIAKGENTTVNDFGNEGSGGQSYMRYGWEAGKTYGLLTRVRPIADGYSEYSAWFRSPDEAGWMLIAKWKRPKIQTWYTRPHSFLENFNNNMGHITRKVLYTDQWVCTSAEEWVELTKGRFTVDATGRPGWRMDYKGGLEGAGFYLQNCGFFDDRVAPDTQFERPATGTPPTIDFSELE